MLEVVLLVNTIWRVWGLNIHVVILKTDWDPQGRGVVSYACTESSTAKVDHFNN